MSYDPFVELQAQLNVTRSSHNWNSKPGNFDRNNTHTLYASTNGWGIPDLPAATTVPTRLIAYNDRFKAEHPAPGDAVHFFLDDYRFETVWTQPRRSLSRVIRAGHALSPDFSLWREMPAAMQLWQVYRSRWCGAWMHSNGVQVIPTMSWSTESSYSYAFAGVAAGSIVAVSSVGIRDSEAKKGYLQGLEAMCDRIAPAAILVYGRSLGEDKLGWDDTEFHYYKTRWDE